MWLALHVFAITKIPVCAHCYLTVRLYFISSEIVVFDVSCFYVHKPLDTLAVGCESSLIHRLLCYGASLSVRHIHHSATASHFTASVVNDKHGLASVFIEDEFSVSFHFECSL